jgi:uncharacterized delta-60 repeat protein
MSPRLSPCPRATAPPTLRTRLQARSLSAPDRSVPSNHARSRSGQPVRSFVLAPMTALIVFAMAAAAPGSAGDLDPTFGRDGIVRTSFVDAFDNYPLAIGVQNDGKIVAAGFAKVVGPRQLFAVARYRRGGRLDGTFGRDGLVTSNVGHVANDIAIEPNGRIVAAGWADHGDFALIRLRRDGRPNSSFGEHGSVVTDICGPRCVDEINTIALQHDGDIVAAGQSAGRFAVAEYGRNGSLDRSFGRGGIVTTDVGTTFEGARDVAAQPDGKVVVAGAAAGDFALARYTLNGRLDATFGNDGIVTTDIGRASDDSAEAVALRRDGKIVVAGGSLCASCNRGNFAVARYEVDGSLDRGFGVDGIVTTPFNQGNAHAYGVVLESHGKVLAAGASGCHFGLTQYRRSGTLDPSFGVDGKVNADVGGCGVANDVARQGKRKVVVTGSSGSKFAVARFITG